MNYTVIQLQKWEKQIKERCRSSNHTCTFDEYGRIVEKFHEQISNGPYVKLYKNCIVKPVECGIKNFENTECDYLETEYFEELKMANKKRSKVAAKRNKSNIRASNNKNKQNEPTVALNSSEDTTAVVLELSKTDEGFETSPGIGKNIVSLNTKSISDYDTPSHNLRPGKYRKKTFISEEVIEERNTENTNRRAFDSNNSKDASREDKSFNTSKDNFTLQDVFNLITDEQDNISYYREYISNGQSSIKVEQNGPNEGDVLVIKLPHYKNRKTTVDMTTSENIANLMFLPVLAEENDRFKRSKPTATTTTTTTVSPLHFNGSNYFPQLSPDSSHQQGAFALIPSNLTFYQPKLQPKKRRVRSKQLGQPYIGDGSLAIPCVFLPTSSIIEPPHQTKAKKKSRNTIRTSNKNDLLETSNSAVAQNVTQPFPVRVTSSNGYDITHFVDLPTTDFENSNTLYDSQAVALKSNEYNAFEFQELVKTSKHPVKQPRKRRQSVIKNKIESSTAKKPKKRASEVQMASTEQCIATTLSKITCERPRKETLVINNESFAACLDMPLINEDIPSEGVYGSQFSAGQAAPVDLPKLTNNGTKQYNQFNIQSSYNVNYNSPPTYTSTSIGKNAEISHTVTTYSAQDDFPISNELLERFFNGEVGEVLGSETNINENINEIQEQQIRNPTIQNAIICEAPIGSVVSMDKFNDDWSFLDDVRLKSTERNAVSAIAINSENSTQNNLPGSQIKNCVDSKNLEGEISTATFSTQVFYNYSLGDELFVENLCDSVQNNNLIQSPEETCIYDNCFGVQHKDPLNQLDKISSHPLEVNKKSSETQIYGNDNISLQARNFEGCFDRERNKVEFRNFSNIIEDHSYSIKSNAFHMKEQQYPIDSEKKLKNEHLLLTKTNIQSHNNCTNDTFQWAQSEHMISSFMEFTEQTFCDKNIEIFDTPPLSNIEENSFPNFPQTFKYDCLENSPKPSSTNQEKAVSIQKENIQPNEIQSNTTTISKQSSTDESPSNTSVLKVSDLFLPPLELESKLDNDILDFDCESILSLENSNNPSINDENGSLSSKSINCDNSTESYKNPFVKQAHTICRTPESPNVRLKSWLEYKNNDVGQSRKTKKLAVDNQGSKKSTNVKKLQEKCPVYNKLVTRRNSETCGSNPKRRQNRLTIDTIPINLLNFKNPKACEVKKTIYMENVINTNPIKKHSQAQEFNTENFTELLKKCLTTHESGSPNNNIPAAGNSESLFSNNNTLNNVFSALTQNTSAMGAVPQFSEIVNSLKQQLLFLNSSSLENQKIHNNNGSRLDYLIDKDQFQATSTRNQHITEESPCIFQPNIQKSNPLNSLDDMGNFFNITCFPSLVEQCPFGTLCAQSHKLRDVDSVRIALQYLSIYEVDTLYKFAFRYMKLYIYYFKEFCCYYAKNQKVSKLCRMFVDCQRYQKFPANTILTIYDCLIDCGLTKEQACKAILKNFWRRTSEFSNKVFIIIVESDWTLFVEHVREFVFDQNVVLNGITLEKMAKSFLNNPNDYKLRLFCKCIFKLEVQKVHGHPALQMIVNNYNLLNVSNKI